MRLTNLFYRGFITLISITFICSCSSNIRPTETEVSNAKIHKLHGPYPVNYRSKIIEYLENSKRYPKELLAKIVISKPNYIWLSYSIKGDKKVWWGWSAKVGLTGKLGESNKYISQLKGNNSKGNLRMSFTFVYNVKTVHYYLDSENVYGASPVKYGVVRNSINKQSLLGTK